MDERKMVKTKLSAVTGRVHVQVVSALSAAIADDPTSLQDPGNLADVCEICPLFSRANYLTSKLPHFNNSFLPDIDRNYLH
jgi:hypothetical protein